jgi:hypothetical protein
MRVRTTEQIMADVEASTVPDGYPFDRPRGRGLAELGPYDVVDAVAVRHAYGLSRRRLTAYVDGGLLVPHVRGKGQHPHLFRVRHVRDVLDDSAPTVASHHGAHALAGVVEG